MTNLESYKERWADFRTECDNLNFARRALLRGFGNEDVGATDDELIERVARFESRYAHEPVARRAERLMVESYRYADM
jgi:hypothetical protein